MKKVPTPVSARAACALVLTLLSGCAVQGQLGKDMRFGIDNAALFGRTIDEFVLPDGSGASVREFEKRYSVKLNSWQRVVGIDNATSVRFRSSQQVDGYTLIVLDKTERNCPYKTHLLAVKGAEVRSWDFGNCRTQPLVAVTGDTAQFDVADGSRTTRYEFSEGRLLYGQLRPRPPSQGPAPAIASTSRAPAVSVTRTPRVAEAVPPAPVRVAAAEPVRTPAPAPAAAQPVVNTGGSSRKTTRATLPADDLVFERKEQAPRTIYLSR